MIPLRMLLLLAFFTIALIALLIIIALPAFYLQPLGCLQPCSNLQVSGWFGGGLSGGAGAGL